MMKPEDVRPETTKITPINLEYLHSAAIVDNEGNETPITEEMILKACQALDPELN